MGDARNHHYVPQGYLRFFAAEKNHGTYQVLVYDKRTKKSYPTNISNIAQEHNFNRIEDSPIAKSYALDDPLHYEKKYTPLVEGTLPQIIRNLTSACYLSVPNTPVISDSMKEKVSRIISTQLLRTPIAREQIKEIGRRPYEYTVASIRSKIMNISLPERKAAQLDILNSIAYTDNLIKPIALDIITSEEHLSRYEQVLCKNHIWVIYRNNSYKSISFFTSDNPVIMINTMTEKLGFDSNALDVPSTVIAFPITPEYLLCLYHKNSLFGKELAEFDNTCIAIKDAPFVESQNALQVQNCKRQVYIYPNSEIATAVNNLKI